MDSFTFVALAAGSMVAILLTLIAVLQQVCIDRLEKRVTRLEILESTRLEDLARPR